MAKRKEGSTQDEGSLEPGSGSAPMESTSGSAPSPEGIKATEEAAAKREAVKEALTSKPERVLPSVPLNVFRAVSGIKPDQFAGFDRWAKKEEMRPCSIPEWKKRYEAFLNKPTQAKG